MTHGRKYLHGFSLLEMVIVVAIIGVVAAIAVPAITAADQSKLDLASSRVADALRYAREESRRTGSVHGVSFDTANNQLQVFRLDESPDPDVKVFDVRDPVSRQLYAIQIGVPPHNNVVIGSLGGAFSNSCNDLDSIVFDHNGMTRCADPLTTRIAGATVELELGAVRSTVVADAYTGRVTVQ